MALKKTKGHLVVGIFYLPRPETTFIIMAAQAGDTDADGILSAGYVFVFALRIIFKAEYEARQGFRIHLGKFNGPNLLYHPTRGGGKTATVAHLKSGFQRNRNGPTRIILTYIGLVNPSSRQIKTGGYAF